jgi:hypothetical protein
MQVNANKYRRKKDNQAGTLTLASGDSVTLASGATLTAASGSTVTLASGATIASTGQTLTTPTIVSPTITGATGVMSVQECLFTQASINGTKTHTATFTVPAGATIWDIMVTNSVLWTSNTSATLKVGLTDDDCFFTAVDVKTVPGVSKSMNFEWPGASNGGASIPEIDAGAGNTQLGATNGFLYSASAQSLTAILTDISTGVLTDGRTRVSVIYSVPSSVIAPVVV